MIVTHTGLRYSDKKQDCLEKCASVCVNEGSVSKYTAEQPLDHTMQCNAKHPTV